MFSAPPNPRIITLCAATFFLLALFYHLSSSGTSLSSSLPNPVRSAGIRKKMAASEKLWAKTVAQRTEVREKFADFSGDFFPAKDSASYFNTPYSVWDLVPASYNCPHDVERIGRMGDGGKWVCGMSLYEANTRPCIIYSFGIQNESSFEQEMLERTNCEIWGYDFSVGGFGPSLKPEMKSRTHFTQAGIAGTTDAWQSPPFFTIQDLMEKNGHTYIDILKIDIEYSEFESLTSLSKFFNGEGVEFPIGQMLIELHLFQYAGIKPTMFLNWWESTLELRGWRPAWTEPNLLAVTLGIEDKNPRLAEYTLVNVKDKRNVLWK